MKPYHLSVYPHWVVAEGNSALYLCRRLEDEAAWIGNITREIVTAAFPGRETMAILPMLGDLFPENSFVPASHVVETILLDYNALLHPGPMFCNSSTVERAVEAFRLFSNDSITPAVVDIIEALDRERLSLCEALGIEAASFEDEFRRQRFVEQGTPLADCLHIDLLAQLQGPFSLKERYLTEDVPYGLVPWCALGALLRVATPVVHACCVLASVLNREDYFATAASAERLGLDRGWGAAELKRYLSEGMLRN